MKNNIYNLALKIRTWFFVLLYQLSTPVYRQFIKSKRPKWEISLAEMQTYPQETLGFQYVAFLKKNNFEAMENFENHDVFHLILNYGTDIQGESSMQFFLLGNGKRSFYMFALIICSIFFFPENIPAFYRAYQRGKSTDRCYDWDFEKLLKTPVSQIKLMLKDAKEAPSLFI